MNKLIGAIVLFIVMNSMLFIAALSRLTSPITQRLFSGYPAHFIAFFAVTFVLSLILMHKTIGIKHHFLVSFLYALFVAVSIEVLQLQFPYRTFSVLDILAGLLGAGLYCLIGFFLEKKGYFNAWKKL